jgi:hypothetical protein
MSDNPCIAAVARILGSNEPPGALATILFNYYTALSSIEERNAFAIAIIGGLLVRKSRASLAAHLEESEGDGAPNGLLIEKGAALFRIWKSRYPCSDIGPAANEMDVRELILQFFDLVMDVNKISKILK